MAPDNEDDETPPVKKSPDKEVLKHADDELIRAWCRSLAARIELMAQEHERDMREMRARIFEMRDTVRALCDSVKDTTEE